MVTRSPQRVEAEFFTAPDQVNHRRYEALRAFFVEGLNSRAGRCARGLHPLVDGQPGTRVPGRQSQAVRPAAQTRPAARSDPGQGPRPRPGDRTAPAGPVDL